MISRLVESQLSSRFRRIAMFERWQISSMRLWDQGSHYSESSNIDQANRLQGKLLLIVGEMDTNVPPESTMRFADKLIKANKDFELLVIPNAGHGMGGAYGQRKMHEFFVRNL